MNSAVWSCWAQTLTQLGVQVTLWLMIGVVLVAGARRRSARAAANTTTWILSGVLLLTVLALLPWPIWYHLPSLAPAVQTTLPLPTGPALPAAPAPPAAVSWQTGTIDRPAPPPWAIPGPASEPVMGTEDRQEPATARFTPWWARIVGLLVTILAAGCLVRLALALWAMRECRRRSRPVLDRDVRQLCEQLRRAMGVHRLVELRELRSLNTAATLGWRRPVILLPAGWRSWGAAERTSVLAHELAHIHRGDYAGWLLAQLSRALHGYQPLLHALIAGLRRDQELAADALAATFAGGPARYTQALCRLALRRDDDTKPGLARAFLPAHLSVTLRAQMLLSRNRRSEPMMAMKWRIGLGLALVGGCLALAGLRSPALAEQEGLFLGTHGNEGTIGEVAPTPGKTAKERELERRLNVPITVDFADIALDHALDRIRQSSGLTIIVDRAALEEEGIDLQRPVTLNLEDVTVKSVLNVLLRSVHLTWVIQDEVVQVTTWKQSRGKLLQRTYSVADLVVPIPNFSTPFPEDATSGTAAPPSPPKTDEQRLIRLIVSTIEPSSWSEVGGRGTIEYFPLGMALVINQTADLHEQIAELLDALRRLQDVTVAVEMRLVSVPEAIAKRLRRQFGINWNTPKTGAGSDAGKVVFLSDIQLFMLMEAIQGDRRTSVLQAPKLTLFNGQNATIQSEDQKVYTTGVETKWDGERLRTTPRTEVVATGLRLGAQAVVSADQQSVRLHLQTRYSEPDPAVRKVSVTTTQAAPNGDGATSEPVQQELEQLTCNTLNLETTVSVPDGSTAVLTGWKRSGAKPTQDAPGVDTHYLLLVTPRIIIDSEDKARSQTFSAPAPPIAETSKQQKQLGDLLARYQQACRERRFDEARKLASEALLLDPECFRQGR